MEVRSTDFSKAGPLPNGPVTPKEAVGSAELVRERQDPAGPEEDGLSRAEMARLRQARIQAHRRKHMRIRNHRREMAEANQNGPVKNGPDKVDVSPAAKRMSEAMGEFKELPARVSAERLAELREFYKEGRLNTTELIQRTAGRMLERESDRAVTDTGS